MAVALGSLPHSVGGTARVTLIYNGGLYTATVTRMDASDNWIAGNFAPGILVASLPEGFSTHVSSSLLDSLVSILLP